MGILASSFKTPGNVHGHSQHEQILVLSMFSSSMCKLKCYKGERKCAEISKNLTEDFR